MKKNYDESWSRLQTALNPSLSRSQSNKSTRRSFAQTCSASSRRISITSQTEHPLIPSWQIKQLFKNKCLDMDIPEVPEQETRFFALSLSNFKNRSFTLSESGLGKRSAVVIGRILKCNHFAFVNLSRNCLKDSGSVALFQEMRNNSSIVHVDLSNNEISPEGFVKIFTMMRVQPSIISLDLSSYDGLHRNRLGEEGAQVLQRLLIENHLLQFLSLSGTSLGEYLSLISDGLHNNTSLISLDLSNNQIDHTCLPLLSSSLVTTSLQKLNLSSNRISDKGCKSLSLLLSNRLQGCCPLNYLNICNNSINKKGASYIFNALRFNNIMEELVIHSNDLSINFQSYFPAFLAENCGLVKLDISNCALNAKSWTGIDAGIAKNRRIEVLNLANNLIHDDGLRDIVNGLAKNKKIRVLDLTSCSLKDGCGDILMKALRGNSSLESIVLKNNNLKEKALEALLDLTRMNRSIVAVNVDSNPVNFKAVTALKAQLRENKKVQQRQVIPKILDEIEKIKEPISKFVETHHEVRKKLEKRIKSEKRLWIVEDNFDEIKEKEEKLTREFKEMLEKLKSDNLKKSLTIEELKNEEIVKFI